MWHVTLAIVIRTETMETWQSTIQGMHVLQAECKCKYLFTCNSQHSEIAISSCISSSISSLWNSIGVVWKPTVELAVRRLRLWMAKQSSWFASVFDPAMFSPKFCGQPWTLIVWSQVHLGQPLVHSHCLIVCMSWPSALHNILHTPMAWFSLLVL